jgi:hypothetical protein
LIIGTLAGTAISWRFGLLLTIPATIILYFFSRDKNRDAHDREVSIRQSGKLSRTYWIACFGFFTSCLPMACPPWMPTCYSATRLHPAPKAAVCATPSWAV